MILGLLLSSTPKQIEHFLESIGTPLLASDVLHGMQFNLAFHMQQLTLEALRVSSEANLLGSNQLAACYFPLTPVMILQKKDHHPLRPKPIYHSHQRANKRTISLLQSCTLSISQEVTLFTRPLMSLRFGPLASPNLWGSHGPHQQINHIDHMVGMVMVRLGRTYARIKL